MSAVATETIPVHLETACYPECSQLAFGLHKKLNTVNYTRGVSLMPVPDTLEDWRADHRTARKRADRAGRLGYRFGRVDMSEHNDDRHEINTSLVERQGRPMTAGYRNKHNHGALPDYPCDRHRINSYGVLQDDVLRAYLTLYRVGDLALVSMILGHGDHLRNDIMYLLFAGVVADQAGQGGVFYYNRHDSGLDGLRFFKERLGFAAADVEWVLQ
jgi:hypothetical protein